MIPTSISSPHIDIGNVYHHHENLGIVLLNNELKCKYGEVVILINL